jgi:hypothetical protein
MSEFIKMNILENIQKFSSHSEKPFFSVKSISADPSEINAINTLISKEWNDITCDFLESSFDIFLILPESLFKYYLPRIMFCSVEEDCPNLIINHSLVNMLDRSPNQEYWDEYFIKRWGGYNSFQYDVIEEWLIWISSNPKSGFSEESVDRAFDTVMLLRNA